MLEEPTNMIGHREATPHARTAILQRGRGEHGGASPGPKRRTSVRPSMPQMTFGLTVSCLGVIEDSVQAGTVVV
jgi:hypothetical protein